jgi:chromosomal replication initiator protein
MGDIQFIGGKDRTQEEFFHTFNYLYNSRKQIVVTSDKSPKEIVGLEERMRTRLEWGLIADIQAPDLETRVAILKNKAEIENITLPDEVAIFLASNIRNNIRELEGSLIRISAFSSLTGSKISIGLARKVLNDFFEERERSVSIEEIQRRVASFFNIKVSDLKSKTRAKVYSEPRQIAMYLSRKYTLKSFPEIGIAFGGKDHTTVLHATRKIEKQLKSNSEIKNSLMKIESAIQ